MAKNSKDLLLQLTSNQVEGPFVTIMLNTQVAFQQVEKSHLKFKNFCQRSKTTLRETVSKSRLVCDPRKSG